MNRSSTLVFACLALAACARPNDGAAVHEASTLSAATTAAIPTISFDADWTIAQSGSLTAGGKAIIHYELSRLATCRATYMQYPAWDVIAEWNVDGGVAFSQSVTVETSSTTRVGTDITIDVPPGRTLNMWFYDSDEYGCQSWDSNYGRNYSFALDPGPPTIHFGWPGFDPVVADSLRSGGPILIDYDIRRLAECRGQGDEGTAWDVTAFYSCDGAPAQAQSLTTFTSAGRVQAPLTFVAPAGAKTLTMWFENANDDASCTAWDSRYGANYAFALQ